MMEMPTEPVKPLDSDCCGQGCVPCVFDIYDEEMRIWQRECERIQNGAVDTDKNQDGGPLLSATEYHSFKIDEISRETHNTYRYRFRLPYGQTLGLQVGQHIIIRGQVIGEVVTRQYTPISDISTTSYFQLMIKIYETGKMSQFIKDWTVGSEVEIRGPVGHLQYKPNQYRRVIMLCVGTGIAPMSQIIQHVLNNESDDTYLELLYGVRTYQDILLKSELDDWARYWNFSVTYYLSQDNGLSNYKYGDKIINSRITIDTLKTVLSDTSGVFVLICGTRTFEKDMVDGLNSLHISANMYHKF